MPERPFITFDEIRRKNVREGDTIIVHKAGDVIPEADRLSLDLQMLLSSRCQLPVQAVVALLSRKKEKWLSLRSIDCPAQSVERLDSLGYPWVMDIDGLGDELINRQKRASSLTLLTLR